MGKKILATNYSVNGDSDYITVKGFYRAEQFQLITDVTPLTGGSILYNFADANLGHKGAVFNELNETTTFYLEADLSAYGIDSTSNLQIIVDHPENEVEVSDSLLDPVHKIRVSTPENLIDTDFEYGLQPTKWETLELSNNVPSFYVADGDTALAIVDAVTATSGSDVIKVSCTDAHNLVVGSPIDVSGLDFRTAEGKFLIVQADSNNFYYRANAPQTVTGEIGSLYTAITPGSFYAGSQISYAQDSGLETNEAEQATITINTNDIHGFVEGSQFYLVNTIASKSLTVKDNGTAPDNIPYIDKRDTLVKDINLDLSKTKTNAIRGRYSYFFSSSSVNVGNNTINWPNHNLNNNYCLLYNPPAGGAQIGGLDRFDIYYVIKVDDNNIQLTTSANGSPITLTSGGDTSIGQQSLHLVYEVYRSYKAYRNSYTYHYPNAFYVSGTDTSGYDLKTIASSDPTTGQAFYGLGSKKQDGVMVMTRNYAYPGYTNRWLDYYRPEYQNVYNAYGGNHYLYTDFPEYDNLTPTNHPSRWNPIEDFGRWSSYAWSSYWREYSSGYYQFTTYYYSGTYNYYWSPRRVFLFPFIFDEEADTLFSANHGLTSGDQISFTTVSGQAPTYNTGASMSHTVANSTLADGTYTVEVASPDRFKIDGYRIQTAVGDSNGAYDISAVIANPTANSFYVSEHGLIDGQAMTTAVVGSPTLPSVPTGDLTPQWKLTQGNAPFMASTVNDFLSDYFANSTDIAPYHTNFRTSNHDGSSTRLIDGTTAGLSGTRPINYTNIQYNFNNVSIFNNGYVHNAGYGGNASDQNVGNINLTKPANMFASEVAKTYGIFRLGTPWEGNASIPYYFDLTFGSDAAHGNTPDGVANTTSWWTYNMLDYTYSPYLRTPTYSTSNYDRTISGSTSGDTWKYSLALMTWEYSWAWTQMMVTISKLSTNAGWSSYTGGYLDTYSSIFRNYGYLQNLSRMKDDITLRLYFAGDTAMNFSTAKATNLVDALIQYIDANFINPTFVNGDTVNAVVLDNNRIALQNGGANIDLTDSGSGFDASNYIKFTLNDVQGAADGSYTAESIGERYINLSTPFNIEGTTEIIDADLIDSATAPIIGGHNFLTGTKVIYTNGSDSALESLTDGGTYYVRAVDDVYIQLHSTSIDAFTGTNPLQITADSANALHTIKTTTVAGRTQAEGTVSIVSGSKKVIGTQTLFKRFFKAGDTIFFKDETNTPGVLYEHTIAVISDDENMELTTVGQFTSASAKHYVKTNVYTKPDGYSVHRPFDGGVEIGAGTAPLSQITRQTRKYFRYQSGKGIQTSLAINFNPPIVFETINSNGTTVRCKTKYPHHLSVGMQITVSGASDESYNGAQIIATIEDDYNFTYTASTTPNASIPSGIIQYTVDGYSGSYTRAGMFDNQNGFFFEYDGQTLNCVRRSSTTQLSGTVSAIKNSGLITGTNTNFTGQLLKGDKIVIRGQTYKVVKINNRTELYVQPQYRGVTTDGIIITKTIDVKVPQQDWNIDKCDGSGKEGFVLNHNKIQMAYMDYSWYGAGKIRFGFKDRRGHVRYVHEFIHNNRLDEAYMRSGNLPAKYEIENGEDPTYAPTLFHWGTSVIMDGTFDDDKAYLFTAPSKSLTFTNGQSLTATTNRQSELRAQYSRSKRTYEYWVRLFFPTSDAGKFSSGTKLYTADNALNGQEVDYTDYGDGSFRVHIYVGEGWSTPSSYPSILNATVVNIGTPATGGSGINLGTDVIPLVSLRLAPSVDNNLTGNLGERDIINRMQLKLNEVGLILTHDCEVKLILNGDISTVTWENVKSPSLSQLIKHESGDQITGGNEVFSFRAAGGANGTSNTSNFSLGDLIDMGNSILGGDGIFPNGPDILTVAIQVVDTSQISASQPFSASSRITWSESQA